jgi:hypothetical protein
MAYEIEPNNSIATANKFAFGVAVSGQISSSADTDVFLYVVDKPSLLSVVFSDPYTTFYSTVISISDSAGNLIGRISATNSAKFEAYIPNAGNYYVQLSKVVANGSQYSLLVNNPPVKTGLIYEAEPNYSFATATKAAFSIPVTGQIASSSDKDVFLYVTDQAGLLSIDFSDPDENFYSTNVSLLDSSGNVLGSISGTSTTKLETYVGSAGSYYVQLSKTVATGSQYMLTVNNVSLKSGLSYEAEPNNTFATATKANFGSPITGQIASRADQDVFLYMSDGEGLFSIDFSDSGEYFYSTSVSLLDSSGNLLGSISGTNSVKLNTYGARAGNYYVSISKSVATGSQYTLTVNNKKADTTPPTIALSTNKTNLVTGEVAKITFTLSESTTTFSAADVLVSGGILSNFAGSGANYSATFTPTADSIVSGVVSVSSGVFTDLEGNANIDGSDADNRLTIVINTLGKSSVGTSGNDDFIDTLSNDTLDGGAGTDSISYSSSKSAYSIARINNSFLVSAAAGGIDRLTNIERLKFADGNLALDLEINQSAGQSALLLGSVLPGKLALDPSKQALVGAVISLFDSGYSMPILAGALLRLDIWSILTGQSIHAASRTLVEDTAIVNYLLTNVYGAAPDTATLKANADAMHSEVLQGYWLAQLALSSAGQSHIGLVGLAATGLNYM